MTTVPGALIWEIVKKNNCFLVKEFGNGSAKVQFSKESNNLYNRHSYKYSGIANPKTVSVQAGGKDSVVLTTTKTRKQNKPGSMQHKSTMKKDFSRMVKAVENQVADNYYRPDLKKAALARLSIVNRSLQVAKSGVKKRNRQPPKLRGRK
ncbi:60S ribosomal protein L28-2 [Spinacia oleracea]|uniref:60S ribosomal protein L28-2 n=1 Tax=Spinacia oleracea TaxID=3562 RepID=A0A9R0J2W3_SPIOL|nr:60S ribosomal protein L28-2-like [Spinacia oleracea]